MRKPDSITKRYTGKTSVDVRSDIATSETRTYDLGHWEVGAISVALGLVADLLNGNIETITPADLAETTVANGGKALADWVHVFGTVQGTVSIEITNES